MKKVPLIKVPLEEEFEYRSRKYRMCSREGLARASMHGSDYLYVVGLDGKEAKFRKDTLVIMEE